MSVNNDERFVQLRETAERLMNDLPAQDPPLPESPAAVIAALIKQRHELQVHQVELNLQNDELARTNTELEHARQEYQELFDFAPVGYLTVDVGGVVGRANLSLCQMLQTERVRLLGRRFSAFVDPADVTTLTLFLRRVLEQPGKRSAELWLVSAQGARYAVKLEGEAISGPFGPAMRPTHCRLAVTDITSQRQAQDEVLRLNTSLEERVEQRTRHIQELSEELETFVYSVTHDLMTPLRHIRSFTGLLRKNVRPLDAQQERYAEHVEQSVNRMERLLQALLTFFRTGQQRIRFQDVDLSRVLREVKKDFAPELERREIQITQEELPVVQGDSLALQLTFANLLGNALKFTRGRDPARIEVCASSTEREHVIAVRDNGVGFNMRQKDRLFGMFQRLHRDSDFEGTGVGLALVRRIIHRHGGRVWAEGKPGQGATFWISLPRSAAKRD